MITDQQQVAEELVEHFATLADGIGGTTIERKSIEDMKKGIPLRPLKSNRLQRVKSLQLSIRWT